MCLLFRSPLQLQQRNEKYASQSQWVGICDSPEVGLVHKEIISMFEVIFEGYFASSEAFEVLSLLISVLVGRRKFGHIIRAHEFFDSLERCEFLGGSLLTIRKLAGYTSDSEH